MIKKIISGGQTGADQAALDAAIHLGIPHGGWIPKGRKTEMGRLDEKYRLREMPTDSYLARTEQNVLDSEGTLILSHGPLIGGSKQTLLLAQAHAKPCLHFELDCISEEEAAFRLQAWVLVNNIRILNVAGPRASSDPMIYQKTVHVLKTAFHA